ncbi:Crp/Fnr family transcriptional regulator [Allomuricauda sp. d1]|uniref:Crp/Fnr family transcriptional regulator n=1 Tax=Allomuricauda sp. d1 TaxID=3136725 RepID=UPI0031CEA6CB
MKKCDTIRVKQLNDFKSLSEAARQKMLNASETLFLPKGSVLFKENQHLNKLYCIREGACKFSKLDHSGQEHILRFLGKGELMGKRAMVTNNGAKVSATALTDTKLCCFDKNEVLENLRTNADFCNDLLSAFVEDANTNEHTRIIFCVHKGIKQRLARLLLYLTDKFGQHTNGKMRIRLKREDMAAVLGTSQEYIINLLARFRNAGFIKVERSEIFILSKEGLQKSI